MSTTQVATATTPQELLVTVRNSAAIKLEFLRALAKKLLVASQKGLAATLAFARRAWSAMPAAVSGSIVAGLTSTKAGYDSIVRATRKAVNSATGILGSVVSFANRAISWVGEKIANAVGYVYKPAGNFLNRVNNYSTSLRYSLVDWVENTYKTVAMVVNGSVKHATTRALVMSGSMAITTGMFVNTFTGGLASAFTRNIPVVGGLLSASLTGNGPLAAITIMAIAGAGISMFFSGREIVANAIVESAIEEYANEQIAERLVYIASQDVDAVEVVAEAPKRRGRQPGSKNKPKVQVSEVIAHAPSSIESVVTESAEGNLAVLVQGDVTVEEADYIAEATIEAEIQNLERQVLQRTYPAKKNHNKKRR
jgi:hypothetical protein